MHANPKGWARRASPCKPLARPLLRRATTGDVRMGVVEDEEGRCAHRIDRSECRCDCARRRREPHLEVDGNGASPSGLAPFLSRRQGSAGAKC
jgi:hypothetical protein